MRICGRVRTNATQLHSLQNFDTWPLTRKPVDGAAKGDAYAPPQHEGDLPSAGIANGKIYKGSCHCGDVTVAMEEEELEGHESKQIMECNCSACERVRPFPFLLPLSIYTCIDTDTDPCLTDWRHMDLPAAPPGRPFRHRQGHSVPIWHQNDGQGLLQTVRRLLGQPVA